VNRTQFGDKICQYGTIQEKIARMNVLQYVTEVNTSRYILNVVSSNACSLLTFLPDHVSLDRSNFFLFFALGNRKNLEFGCNTTAFIKTLSFSLCSPWRTC
jgi:hypothetical protein